MLEKMVAAGVDVARLASGLVSLRRLLLTHPKVVDHRHSHPRQQKRGDFASHERDGQTLENRVEENDAGADDHSGGDSILACVTLGWPVGQVCSDSKRHCRHRIYTRRVSSGTSL
jgi:hypothetical protein